MWVQCHKPKVDFSTDEFVGLTHGGLNVDTLEVLPSLLEEGDQEVDTHKDVLSDFFFSHGFVTDGDVQACGLLQLELDGGSGVVDLGSQVFVVGDDLGEHTDSVKNGSEDGGDLLDEGVGGKEKGVLLGPLLDEFLVLVEGLEAVKIDDIDVDVLLLDGLQVLGISDEANSELRSGNVRKSDGTSESLILLGIVILQTDLEFNGLNELSLLLFFEDSSDGLSDLGLSNVLGH